MRRTLLFLMLSALPAVGVVAACDSDDTTFTRQSGNADPDGSDAAEGSTAPSEAGGDGSSDAAAEGDAPGVPGVRKIATGSGENPIIGGGDHTCVIAGVERSVYCWGANDYGQIGNGLTGAATTAADVPMATKIATDENGLLFAGIDEIAAAAWHTCARRADLLFCWGQRYSSAQAEPAADPAIDRTKPRPIGNLPVKAIAAGGPHTCALKTNGRIVCFGHSYFNELGRPNPTDLPCTAPLFRDYGGIATHVCSGDLTEAAGMLASPVSVVAGEVHSCAHANGSVYCWGTNFAGQLGVPSAGLAELNPQRVVTDATLLTPMDGVTAVSTGGGKHTCAVRAGTVWCWGINTTGQLGADPLLVTQRPNAAVVPGLDKVADVGVADGVTCAVKDDGTVWCWGDGALGQLGDAGVATSFAPVQIKGPAGVGNLTGVKTVAPGRTHVCALKTDSTVWCWGKNDRGQLGDGTLADSAYPVKVLGLPP